MLIKTFVNYYKLYKAICKRYFKFLGIINSALQPLINVGSVCVRVTETFVCSVLRN